MVSEPSSVTVWLNKVKGRMNITILSFFEVGGSGKSPTKNIGKDQT